MGRANFWGLIKAVHAYYRKIGKQRKSIKMEIKISHDTIHKQLKLSLLSKVYLLRAPKCPSSSKLLHVAVSLQCLWVCGSVWFLLFSFFSVPKFSFSFCFSCHSCQLLFSLYHLLKVEAGRRGPSGWQEKHSPSYPNSVVQRAPEVPPQPCHC